MIHVRFEVDIIYNLFVMQSSASNGLAAMFLKSTKVLNVANPKTKENLKTLTSEDVFTSPLMKN